MSRCWEGRNTKCGRVHAALLWRWLVILDLACSDIDNQLSELIGVARAFWPLAPMGIFAYSYRSKYRFFRISNLDHMAAAKLNAR